MYIVHRTIIEDNINKIKAAFGDDLLLSYSVKTNSMNDVLRIIDENNVLFEVVSQPEYLKTPSENMKICNGVAMTYCQMARAIENLDIVNFNDVMSIAETRKAIGNNKKYSVGLRVRFDDNSRFGVYVKDIPKALDVLKENGFTLFCLHCHITNTRGKEKYRLKVKNMIDAIIEYDIQPEFIDFGGSMYGQMPAVLKKQFDDVCGFKEYADIINNEIARLFYSPRIILELGTALISNAVDVVGTVVRVDEYNRVVLDIDKFTVGMMRNKKLPFLFWPNGEMLQNEEKTVYSVNGCTCIEDDVLIKEYASSCKISVGDKFVFKNCGAYSHCFEPDFIIPKQEVIVV